MKSIVSLLLCLCLGVSRPVYQNDRARRIYCSAPNPDKKIALTFDDGPHPQYTEEILDILKQYGIKATFFAIGENVTYYPEVFEKVVADGHEIGNHTFSQPHMQNESSARLRTQIKKTNALLQKQGAVNTHLFRPPAGVCSNAVCRAASEMGYDIILWTVDTCDWRHTDAERIVESVKSTVKSGDIILFHDYITAPSPTPAALRQLIPALLEKGYRFVTVSELIA